MTQVIIPIAASGDDTTVRPGPYTVYGSPGPANNFFPTATEVYIARELGAEYWVFNVLLKWDTSSSIPDSATITSAKLRLRPSTIGANVDALSVTADYYTWSGVPADWSETPQTSAHAGTPFSAFSLGVDKDLDLLNPDTNISKTGITYLRLHASGGAPTGINELYFTSYDGNPALSPRLVVDYEVQDYLQLGSDGVGKKERTQTMTVGSDTVHIPYQINTDNTTGDPAVVTNAPPQATNYGLVSRDIDDRLPGFARTEKVYYFTDVNNPGTTEALQTTQVVSDGAQGTAATTFTVPAGKTFRVQLIAIGGRIVTNTSPGVYATAGLHVNTGGAATTSSPLVIFVTTYLSGAAAVNVGMIWQYQPIHGDLDIPAGASFGLGLVSMAGTAARTVWSATLIGYEY